MRLKKYIINEMSIPSWITRLFGKAKEEMKRMTFQQFKNKCEDAFDRVIADIDPQNLDDFLKKHGFDSRKLGESVINEDAKHWWELIKTEAFPTLAFYPALQVWLEFDKMLKGTQYSGTVIAFYATFWLLLISGKYIKGWMEWKKTNPAEYSKEKESGGGGLI